jgi:hypothetical protein
MEPEKLSVSPASVSRIDIFVSSAASLPLLCENLLQKSKWCPKSYANVPKPKKARNLLNLGDRVKIWDLLKGSIAYV